MTSKPGIPLTEPQTPTGRAMVEDYAAGDMHPDDLATLSQWVAKIEREARGIPLIDVELLARAIDASWADLLAPLGGQSDGLRRSAEKVAAEYTRLVSESSTPATDTRSCRICGHDWGIHNPECSHLHPTCGCTRFERQPGAGLPVEEGDR